MNVEMQDIFVASFNSYTASHSLTPVQWKAARAIMNCRTAALGAHIDTCDRCGFTRISYNSCRNRHCPKCQTFAKEEWVDKQQGNLLNTHYFHVVFTVPSELNPVFLHRPGEIYSLLFQAASEVVLELCADKKYLGAKPGITAVLHTWGQNLLFHSHVHNKSTRMALCRRLTNTPMPTPTVSVFDRLRRILGPDYNLCPCCKRGLLSRDSPSNFALLPVAQ